MKLQYLYNPPLIEKLHEEKQIALASSLEFESQIEAMRVQIRDLELENTRLSALVSNASQRGLIGASLSILSVILMAIGVNIVTDKPYTWAGWVMISASITIQIAILISRPKEK